MGAEETHPNVRAEASLKSWCRVELFSVFSLLPFGMIDISQWRINIGLWHCCHVLRSTTKGAVNVTGLVESLLCSENGDVTNLVFSLIMFLLLLLILSGDVELNPGPLTGKHLHLDIQLW